MFILNELGLVRSGFGLGFYQNLDLLRVFFFLNPNPTLFFIGPGKTRPIRIELGQVPMSRAEIAIPTHKSKEEWKNWGDGS